MGGYLRLIFTKNDFKPELVKNISITTKLDLFTNYLDHPEAIDVSWELLLGLKVNKFLSVNLTTHLIYDRDVLFPAADGSASLPKVQFKEIFGVGLSFQF